VGKIVSVVGVVVVVVVVVVMMIVMTTTTKPLSRLLSIVPDLQSQRLLHLASRLFQTPLRHAQHHDPLTNKPLIPRWINPFILHFV
jgi:ABC-type lipoprotein release transport system permease subunit